MMSDRPLVSDPSLVSNPPPVPDRPLVEVADLVVEAAGRRILDGVGLTLAAGTSVGLVGASGSGKTTTALTLLGYLRQGMRHTAGTVRVHGEDVLPDPPPGLRGDTVGFLSQDPGQSLNPYRRIGAALMDLAGRRVRRAARAEAVSLLLRRVGLPGDPAFARRFPHQLSGGQQQRVALALALSQGPRLLVLDEPTTGLDASSRAEVVDELRRVNASGVGLLWISHDLGVLRSVADRVLVMEGGRVVEDGPTEAIFARPASDVAIKLVAAVPSMDSLVPWPATAAPPVRTKAPGSPLLQVRDLAAGHGRRAPVLHGVDLDVYPGEFVAVLGVSGVGKTTLGRCLVGLHRPASGRITLAGEPLAADVRQRTRAQQARLQLVAQDPAEALHPRQTVRDALARPLTVLRGIRGARLGEEVDRLLTAVRIPGYADRLPQELSGGERQRVALARALAAAPRVLVCDEITSALDLITQAAVLDLLADMRRELALAVVLITHDLGVAATADRRVVLVDGRVGGNGGNADPPVLLKWPARDAPASPVGAPPSRPSPT